MTKNLKTAYIHTIKVYSMKCSKLSKTNEIKIKTLAIIISKINFAFLYFFGRKKLNKITVANISAKNTSTITSSPAIHSINVSPRIIRINNIFSKANNTFNAIKEYLINIATTYYKKGE